MGERTSHKPGTFSWADLSTTDPDGAKRFYADLFGWEHEDMPAGEGMTYTMSRIDGSYVAALSAQQDQERQMGIPPHWNNYVSVDDADATAAKVAELGGTVIMEPFDVFTSGRMAVLQDPAGAMFMVWQPRENIGAEVVNVPGALTWNDLTTPDPDAAAEFYGQLFGWRSEKMEGSGDVDYRIWWNGDRTNGGMLRLSDEMKAVGVPPNWMPYFATASVDETRQKAEAAGGATVNGPNEVPQGRFVVLKDPQGAVFAVVESEFDD